MKYITGDTLNGLLYQIYSTIEVGFNEIDYRVDFWDFVGSQTKAKILDFDYRDLLKASVAVNKLYSGNVEAGGNILDDIRPLYMCFLHYMSIVGIKLYFTKGVKLYFTIPVKLYESGIECELIDASDDRVNIVDYYPVDENLNYYLNLMKSEVQQFNYKSIPLDSIDFEYLSKMKMYYESYKSEIMVIERRK